MNQHHFVVKYSIENGWEWDTETESANFPDGTIYTDEGEWTHSGHQLSMNNPLYDIDERASEALNQALRIMNQVERGTNV